MSVSEFKSKMNSSEGAGGGSDELENDLADWGQTIAQAKETPGTTEYLLDQLADREPKTGLLNRRAFEEKLEPILSQLKMKETERRKEAIDSVAVIFIDLDHFKKINDTMGHQFADKVLLAVAEILKNNIRASDLACRFGGEEMVVALPGANIEEAKNKAEQIRQKIEKIAFEDQPNFSVTASLGLAVADRENTLSVEEIAERADQAMYQAKEAGRNKTVIFGEEEKREKSEKIVDLTELRLKRFKEKMILEAVEGRLPLRVNIDELNARDMLAYEKVEHALKREEMLSEGLEFPEEKETEGRIQILAEELDDYLSEEGTPGRNEFKVFIEKILDRADELSKKRREKSVG